ncbi:rhodanese-like domain-containing protein [Undibacterium sp. Ren11W]
MNFLGKIMQGLSGAASEVLAEDALLIDVRSPGEYASGYIEGAISLPLDSIANSISTVVSDKAANIIVYCRSGARSSSAKNILAAQGYLNVSNGGGVGTLALKLQKPIRRS